MHARPIRRVGVTTTDRILDLLSLRAQLRAWQIAVRLHLSTGYVSRALYLLEQDGLVTSSAGRHHRDWSLARNCVATHE